MSSTFKLDAQGLRTEVLQADFMRDYVKKVAVDRADSDSHIKDFIGFDRAKAIIYPNTEEHPK